MHVIGVDVGTGSVRAGLFTKEGVMLASAVEPIKTWKPRLDFVEQSSENIWLAVGTTVRSVLKQSGIAQERIVGISFDATCSLVVLNEDDEPLTVSQEGDSERNVIVWMDHRALKEADEINLGDYTPLKYVGGKVSPEMETPKLLWLKRNLPKTWSAAGKFFDLADYLTFRSTGDDARSLCTVVCKWTYLGHLGESGAWDKEYFNSIGLSELLDGKKIGTKFSPMGTRVGNLTPKAAKELGLTENCAVGIGIIDAHAGGLGLLGAIWKDSPDRDPALLETVLALIGGTSACHMAVSREPRFIEGVWGPYYGAMVSGMWLTEGGQSAAGSAIDHVIEDHANFPNLLKTESETSLSRYELLNAETDRLRQESGLPYPAQLTKNIHILPYFLGNRSPNADPRAVATIEGLNLDASISSQALRYYAAIQAVAYGTRDIVQTLNESGYRIDTLFATGGGVKNPLWLQEHADATGLPIVLAREPEAVLLGSAILAATAAQIYPDVTHAMQAMSVEGETIRPNFATSPYHDAKFKIFKQMYRQQLERRKTMSEL